MGSVDNCYILDLSTLCSVYFQDDDVVSGGYVGERVEMWGAGSTELDVPCLLAVLGRML